MRLLNLAKAYVAEQVEQTVKEAVSPLAPYLKRLVFGVVLVLVATPALLLCLIALAGGLFLALAGLPYVAAALYTSLIFFGIALVLAGIGALLLRKPR